MEIISLELSGNFGFFLWGDTKGDKRYTDNFISKTEVLGIFGAVMGLDGYSQINFLKEKDGREVRPFFDVLNGLNVAIIPLKRPTFFDDALVHRNMHHVNTNGTLMVSMKGLVSPSYRVLISKGEVEDAVFEELKERLLEDRVEFIPYFGKNQFPVEINNVEVSKVKKEKKNEITIQSLFLEEKLTKEVQVSDRKLRKNDDAYHFVETLKFFSDGGKIQRKKVLWTSFDCEVNEYYVTSKGENILFL